MRLRPAMLGFALLSLGFSSVISACATSVGLEEGGDDDDDVGSASSSSSSGKSSSSSSGGSSSGGKKSSSSSSSSGSSNSNSSSSSSGGGGGTSGMLPPGPAPGSACEEPLAEYKQGCGLCGKQTAVCILVDGAYKVSQYGECTGEVEDGCRPGTSQTAATCGYCGTVDRTCSNACKWVNSGSCQGEVSGTSATRCKPGETRVSSLTGDGSSCEAGSYVTHTCYPADSQYRCRWNAPLPAMCAAPGLNAPAKGQTASFTVLEDMQSASLHASVNYSSTSCPTSTTESTVGAWVQVRNATSAEIKVKVSSIVSGADLVLVTYGSTKPTTDAQAKACVALNDTCGSAGIQSCVNNLSIAANSHIWVFSGRYGSYQTTPAEHELRVDTL